MKPNREEEYPVFFHLIHPAEVRHITVFGDIELSYFGFGDESENYQQYKCNVGFTLILGMIFQKSILDIYQRWSLLLQSPLT